MFGVPPIIKYVESVLAAKNETTTTSGGDVEMKQEETKEMATETLAQRYARILAADKAQMS